MKINVFLYFHLFLTHCANMVAWLDYSFLPAPPRKDFPKSHILTFSRSAVLATGRNVRTWDREILKSFLLQCSSYPPWKDFPKSNILTFSRSAVLAPGRNVRTWDREILESFLVQCRGSPSQKDFPKSHILTFSRSAVLAPGRKGGLADERVNVLPNEPHGLMECPCVIF